MSRFLRLPEVMELTGLSRATIYRYADDGAFPRPVKLTKRAVGWKSDEVEAWLSARGLGVSVGVSASAA
jgi:prophage regulatory protein